MEDGVIVVEDRVDMQCMRHVHWMSNVPSSKFQVPGGKWTKEAGAWHLRWSGPYRGALDVHAEGWVKMRRLVVWSLAVSDQRLAISVRQALHEAAMEFERLFGGRAKFGFMKKLPKGAEHGMMIGGLMLLEAEWMLERAVAVGGRAGSG